jgi:peptide/nickel transport system substrate-binding protein
LVDHPLFNKISRRTALALPLGLAASSSTLLGGLAKADEPVRGGTMVMIVQPEPSTLAHYAVTAGNIPPIATQIYEGLVTYDWDQNPQPNLATSWETAPDGKSITFKLREGVVFHNGKPFTSADVQFSFMEILKKYHPFAPLLLAELTGVDTPDPMTAVLRLDHPAPYLMKALAGRDLPIMCKSVFEGTQILQNPTANKPIGTGPFKFGQWDRGQFVRLDRNDKYWKPGLPYLDHIIARFIPDAATRSAALETGEAHFAGYSAVNYADLARMKTNPILDTTMKGYEMTPALSVLELNAKHPPLDKKEVR